MEIKKYDLNNTIGATSISDISGIPRATCVRKLEKLVKMNVRLKNELKVNSDSYWKNTHRALHKISERLVKLANKVGQLQ